MLFGYSGDGGTQCMVWYHGTVQEEINEKTNLVRIKWYAKCLGEHDVRVTYHKLVPRNWNQEKVKKGGWREYLPKK